MINSGVSSKVICVVTDIQDWKDGKVVRLENDSAIMKNFGYPSWKDFYEERIQFIKKLAIAKKSEILIVKKATDFKKAKRDKKAVLFLGQKVWNS